jgi:hypothetical protein
VGVSEENAFDEGFGGAGGGAEVVERLQPFDIRVDYPPEDTEDNREDGGEVGEGKVIEAVVGAVYGYQGIGGSGGEGEDGLVWEQGFRLGGFLIAGWWFCEDNQ